MTRIAGAGVGGNMTRASRLPGAIVAALALRLAPVAFAAPVLWPQFRGPGGSGVSPEGNFPTHFGPNSNVVWKVPMSSGHSSPCIWGDRIFLTGFESNRLTTLCLDRAAFRRGFSTPLLWPPDKPEEVIVAGTLKLVSYALNGGAERWSFSGLPNESLAVIFEKSQNALYAIRPGGTGGVTQTHVAWKQFRGLPYVPSPIHFQGRLYLVKNGGLASCFEGQTGKALYLEERLGALGNYYSSPVAAAGKICAASHAGVVAVFRAGDTLEILARNALGEPILATPAIGEGNLYLRTKSQLYAFGERENASRSATEGLNAQH